MKHFLALGLALTTFEAFSATTATLLIKGTVPSVLSVSVTPESVASNLPLTISQTNTKVATVQEKSNSNTGYKVTISSSNLGKLVRTSGSENVPYTMAYNGTTLNLAAPVTQSNPASAAVTTNKNLTISYVGAAEDTMVAGDYSDTITFTIAAN